MIDIRKLKELVKLMVQNDLSEMDLRDTEDQVTIRRASLMAPPQVVMPVAAPVAGVIPGAGSPHPSPLPEGEGVIPGAMAAVADDDSLVRIESPMVGTFYTSSNPDTPAFVKIGDSVDTETVVCIIEAMKIFNEIKAECSGTIAKVLVKNGDAVEFGQALFVVNPD